MSVDFNTVLLFTLPSLITGGLAYVLIQKFITNEARKQMIEVRKENTKFSLPIRMQSYERLILLLERIDPVSVINRVIKPGMNTKQMQFLIINTISEEFNHNITQQLYVSANLWETVKKAKEDAIKLVSLTAGIVPPNADAMDFSRKLIEIQAEKQLYTSKIALDAVKQEVKTLF